MINFHILSSSLLLLVDRVAVLRTRCGLLLTDRPTDHTTQSVTNCYRLSSVVCRSVCHTSEPCKKSWTDHDVVCVEDLGGPRKLCIRWGLESRSPMGLHNFEGESCAMVRRWRFLRNFCVLCMVCEVCEVGYCQTYLLTYLLGGWRLRLEHGDDLHEAPSC